MNNKCLRCNGELKELPQPPGSNVAVKTFACQECGLIENRMKPEMVKHLMEKKKND